MEKKNIILNEFYAKEKFRKTFKKFIQFNWTFLLKVWELLGRVNSAFSWEKAMPSSGGKYYKSQLIPRRKRLKKNAHEFLRYLAELYA